MCNPTTRLTAAGCSFVHFFAEADAPHLVAVDRRPIDIIVCVACLRGHTMMMDRSANASWKLLLTSVYSHGA